MLLAWLVLIPTLIGLVTSFVRNIRSGLALLVVAALAHLGLTIALLFGWPAAPLGQFLALDALSLLFLSITSGLFLVVSLYTVPYVLTNTHGEHSVPRYFVPCLLWFLAAMTLVCVTQNLAAQWAAIEATTLASAPLVYYYRRKEALEAAWKYLLVCSVGIALALLGVFFLGVAASAAKTAGTRLQLADLLLDAPGMSRTWLKAAFVLALVGFGTKMGLAPLHTWLPDTHSQAPSPVSALLSGAQLNCALLAILRFYQICLASGDAEFARSMLLLLGFASLVIACVFMFGQRDYKRLFAYSSIENMGIIAVGIGFGGAATDGAMLHAVNHSICKAGLFMVAGNILRGFGTTQANQVRGVWRRLPVSGFLMAGLLLALGGAPPFGPFVSEWWIFQSAVSQGRVVAATVFVGCLALCFLAMLSVIMPMLQGTPPDANVTHEPRLSVLAPMTMLAASLVLGVYLPAFLVHLTKHASGAVGG